jgi:hypothetical protein
MKSLSLTARISLLFAAGAAAVLLGLGWVVERSVESHFEEMDRHEMEGKLTLLRMLFARAPGPEVLSERMAAALVGHHHLSVTVAGGGWPALVQLWRGGVSRRPGGRRRAGGHALGHLVGGGTGISRPVRPVVGQRRRRQCRGDRPGYFPPSPVHGRLSTAPWPSPPPWPPC